MCRSNRHNGPGNTPLQPGLLKYIAGVSLAVFTFGEQGLETCLGGILRITQLVRDLVLASLNRKIRMYYYSND